VPVLEEGDFVLPESAVINEYLEDRYPEPSLWPADPAERAAGRLLVHRFDEHPRSGLVRSDDDGPGRRRC
jgi:glutathione S-transferase